MLTSAIGKISLIDISVIVTYLIFCLLIGFRKAGDIKNIKEFALGDGKISTAALVATLFATYLGAGVTFGTIEKVSTVGILFAFASIIGPIRWLIIGHIFGRNIEQFKGCLGMGDIMRRLYGMPGKILGNFAVVMNAVGTVALQSFALGYMLHYFLEIPVEYGMICSVGTLVIYSMMGGVKAVVMTDTLQFAIFYVLIPILCAIIVQKLGGVETVALNVPDKLWTIEWNSETIQAFIGFTVFCIVSDGNTGAMYQRFLISSNAAQLVKSLRIVALIELSLIGMLIILGITLSTQVAEGSVVMTLLYEIFSSYLPTLVTGIMVVGIMSIIMSTADSYLNNAAVILAHDVCKSLYPKMSDRMEVMVARISTAIVGLLSVYLSLNSQNIIDLMWKLLNFYDPITLLPMVAGFLYFRTNAKSFVISIIMAFIGSFLGVWIQGEFQLLSYLLGCSFSAMGLFGAHYIQKYTGLLKEEDIAKWEKKELYQQACEEAERNNTVVPPLNQVWPLRKPVIAKGDLKLNVLKNILRLFKPLSQLRLKHFAGFCQRGIMLCPPKYYQFAFFGFFCCIFPALFPDSVLSQAKFDNEMSILLFVEATLRIFCSIGCIAMILSHSWRFAVSQKYLAVFWHVMLLLCLPMLSTYSFIVDPGRVGVTVGAVMSILVLAAFVDWLSFVVLSMLGFTFGHLIYASCALIAGVSLSSYGGSFEITIVCLAVAFLIAAMMRYAQENEIKMMKVVGGAIAHEVRSPMASAYAGIGAVLDSIKKSDAAAINSKKIIIDGKEVDLRENRVLIMQKNDYELVDYVSENIKSILAHGMQSAESILAAMSSVSAQDNGKHSVLKIVHDAIKTHYMTDTERDRIEVRKNSLDFDFYGSYKMFKHVIHNLLASALKYADNNAKISIWTSGRNLHFRDNSNGMLAANASKVFDFDNNKSGTGLGLAFCKTVLIAMDSNISCISEANKYTEFVITFPELKQSQSA